VIRRQVWQDRLVYLILAERRLILPEAQARQPDYDVHDAPTQGCRTSSCGLARVSRRFRDGFCSAHRYHCRDDDSGYTSPEHRPRAIGRMSKGRASLGYLGLLQDIQYGGILQVWRLLLRMKPLRATPGRLI
jgi:hypothetical protein